MSTTKSIASDTSSRASSTVSEFVRRIANDFSTIFPPFSALGRDDSYTDDSSYDDDHDSSMIFAPIEFNTDGNIDNVYDIGNDSTLFRQQGSQFVLTEKDSAWFPPGKQTTAMEDYAENEFEDDDYNLGIISVPTSLKTIKHSNKRNSKRMIKNHRRANNKTSRNRRRRTKQVYDKTTFWLAVLCTILTILLACLLGVVRPFGNKNYVDNSTTNSNNNNDSSSVVDNSNATFVTPTLAPVESESIPTINSDLLFPTREPQKIPTKFPTSKPIATTQEPTANANAATEPTARPTSPSTKAATKIEEEEKKAPTKTPTRKPIVTTQEPNAGVISEPIAGPTQSIKSEGVTGRAPVPTAITIEKEEQTAPESAQTAATNSAASARQPIEVPPLAMGPIVGHTAHDSVTLWAYHDFQDYTLEILLYDSDTDGLLRTIDLVSPRKDRNNAIIETITGLAPSTFYKYGMHINGERVGKGSFKTAPLPEQGAKFDYILASCMNYRQYKNQIVWEEIVKNNAGKHPDFSILAGDTVYLQEGVDVTIEEGVKFDRVWFRNKEQRNEKHFANLISNSPTYSTWNDHEYGSNNANRDQKGKGNSLRAWESLWANPGYGEEYTDDGVYFSYYWGNVHYIVTDDHWYRDPSSKNRLGQKQTDWIRNELIGSRATFKVIVIGSDIMERNWKSDLNNIGDIVRENKIDGVLFHAGDIHRNEFKKMEAGTGGFPYPVTQITSSGIAKVWRRPYVHIHVDTTIQDPSIKAHFYGASSTTDTATWTNDPNLRCSSIQGEDRDKEHTCTETIRLSHLRAL
uniref:PhoD-like phosphatase metallophosphatase domain-containing protein n=1 Tax=Pseudo-nitzschia australis TaxID=44445 RepID=A0A6U9XTA2_9STRA|mmetsp:Transcript_17128/g.37464  ORF Transcript_17128/g.37464 Transcript_17128/m.37464 type:complete len:801 (-) Transcript_17128:245-2647(-)